MSDADDKHGHGPGTPDIRAVATYSALRRLGAETADLVFVLGGSSAGDGGEGLFYWNETSTAADDNAIVIKPQTNPASGRWIREAAADRRVKASWFGARPAAADNAPAVQAAIDYLGEAGGVVEMGAGNYTFTAGISAEGYRGIVLRGVAATSGRSSATLLRFTAAGTGRCISYRGTSQCWVEDCYICYANPGFTGSVVDFTHSPAGVEASSGGIRRCVLTPDGSHKTATLVNLNKSINMLLEDTLLSGGAPSIQAATLDGSGYCNVLRLNGAQFVNHSGPAIVGGGEGWVWVGVNCEGDKDGRPNMMATNAAAPILGLSIQGFWCGDASVDGTWFTLFGAGLLCSGSELGGTPGSFCFSLNNFKAAIIVGNNVISFRTFVDFSAATCTDPVVVNRYQGVTNVLGSVANASGLTIATDVQTGGVFMVAGDQVVGARGAAVADATGPADAAAKLNLLLERMRAHGLIAR